MAVPVAHYGHEAGWLSEIRIVWSDTERGRSATGTAIRTQAPCVNQNLAATPHRSPWAEGAVQRGYLAAAALPLKDREGVFGSLTIYASDPDAFNRDELVLMQKLAEDVSFGIQSVRTERQRRDSEQALKASEERFRQLADRLTATMETITDGFFMVDREWRFIDNYDEPRTVEQILAVARARTDQSNRLIVLIGHGKRRRPRMAALGLVTVDGNALGRHIFLKAVAAVAGRVSLEAPKEKIVAGKLVANAPTREEALMQGRLILVADDNETNQKVIVRQLALLGYTADVAADGQEAFKRWQSGDYALLITDLHMPQMDGYELTQAIRAEEKDGKRIPIVALTANALKGEADRCRAVGMDDYRSKPSPLAELKSVLEHWLPATHPTAVAPSSTTVTVQEAAASVPIDVNVLKELIGDDSELIREFLREFRASARKTAAQLRVACNNGEAEQVGALAHKLKSAALSAGALALGKLCTQMEEGGQAGDNPALTILLAQFNQEMAAVEQCLAKILEATK